MLLIILKNHDIQICDLKASRINNIALTINQTHDIIEADKLHSELSSRIDFVSVDSGLLPESLLHKS